jgi:hypothetical protein
MKKSKRNRKTQKKQRSWLYVFVLVVSFAVSTAAGFIYFKDKFAFESSFIEDIESRLAKTGHKEQKDSSFRLYKTEKQAPAIRSGTVYRKDTLLVVTEDIIRKNVRSYEVRLLDLYMDKEGIIYIDFGDEIIKNFHGDASEELLMLAGLYKSIKSTVLGFTALKILVEGREVESFGGHIDISKPIGEEIAEGI